MKFKEYKLGYFIDSISDTTKIDKDKVVLINTSDVENGKVLNHEYVENKNLRGQFKKRFKKEDILYSEIRPQNKRFAYVDFDSSDYIASTKLMVLRNKGNIYNKFLFYLLKNDKMINYLQNEAVARSGTFPQITFETIKNAIVKVPELKTQKKIVEILEKIDNKLTINNEINNNLYELSNKLFEQYFINPDNKEWQEYTLTDLVEVNNGYSYKGSELVDESEIGMATIKNFNRTGGFKIDGYKSIDPIKAKENQYLNLFDILIACTDLTQAADIIGNAVMVLNRSNYKQNIMSMDLVKLSPIDENKRFVIYSIVNSKQFKAHALGYKSGTTVLHLNKQCFNTYSIKLPEEDTLLEFNEIIKNNYKMISSIIEENIKLEQLRDTLLPKLMNGEIDLDKIEI